MIKLWNNKFKIGYIQWLEEKFRLMYIQHPRENTEDIIYIFGLNKLDMANRP